MHDVRTESLESLGVEKVDCRCLPSYISENHLDNLV